MNILRKRLSLLVRVKLFATLTKFTSGQEPGIPFVSEIPDGSSLLDLMAHLKLPEESVKLLFVNGRAQPAGYILNNNDDVGIFPPIGGG
jgi:sulfur-carrier protein